MSSPSDNPILRTLAYFDVFSYPLTEDELWRWLWPKPGQPLFDRQSLPDQLRQLADRGLVVEDRGYWMLAGNSGHVDQRQQRQADNQRKWKRAQTTARFLELVPFVRMVAIVNTAAIRHAKPASDIDLLIVLRSGWLWFSRLLVTGIVSMLGYRRHGNKIANRICLSFYVTNDALDLGEMRKGQDDMHYLFWASQAVPLLNIDHTFEQYMSENRWVTKELPNAFDWNWQLQVLPQNGMRRGIRKMYELLFLSPIGLWIEDWARRKQYSRIHDRTHSRVHDQTSDVVVSDQVLKFHEADRRQEYNTALRDRLNRLQEENRPNR